MFNTTSRGGRLRPAALLAAAALALGLGTGLGTGPAAAAICSTGSVTTGGIAALDCSSENPLRGNTFSDKIDDIEKGADLGEFFFITVTEAKNEALAGTWSLKPGLSFAAGASYALALKGGPKTLYYTLATSATSGTWSTADLLVGKKGNQAGLSNIRMVGSVAPAPVPQPAAAWLLLGGVAGLAGLLRRRASPAA